MKASFTAMGLVATLTFLACVPAAQARQHSRSAERTASGGDVQVTRANNRFSAQRGRQWQSDGQGNATLNRQGAVTGSNGGQAEYDTSAWRNADGSAGRQHSASATLANGATATTTGSVSRGADGTTSGARSTSATAASGASYAGSTTLSDGKVVHSATCTNAAGETVACTGGH